LKALSIDFLLYFVKYNDTIIMIKLKLNISIIYI
jgi:hypothetical protein